MTPPTLTLAEFDRLVSDLEFVDELTGVSTTTQGGYGYTTVGTISAEEVRLALAAARKVFDALGSLIETVQEIVDDRLVEGPRLRMTLDVLEHSRAVLPPDWKEGER